MESSAEITVQTRVPESLQHSLKFSALKNQRLLKAEVTVAIELFLASKPWLCGTWVKQPKNKEFKPITVKIPHNVGVVFEDCAQAMEVSTSSFMYTALDWYANQLTVNTK